MQAVGASTGIVIGRAIIRDLYERDRAAAMIGLVTTAMVIAPMIAPLIGGILDTAFGWEAIFLFIAAFSGAVLLWAVFVLPETRPASVAHTPGMLMQEWRALIGSAKFLGYVLCGALGSAPFFAFLGGGPHVVVTLMGRTSAEYGVWFAVTSLGYMSGNFTASRLSQRFGVDCDDHGRHRVRADRRGLDRRAGRHHARCRAGDHFPAAARHRATATGCCCRMPLPAPSACARKPPAPPPA